MVSASELESALVRRAGLVCLHNPRSRVPGSGCESPSGSARRLRFSRPGYHLGSAPSPVAAPCYASPDASDGLSRHGCLRARPAGLARRWLYGAKVVANLTGAHTAANLFMFSLVFAPRIARSRKTYWDHGRARSLAVPLVLTAGIVQSHLLLISQTPVISRQAAAAPASHGPSPTRSLPGRA